MDETTPTGATLRAGAAAVGAGLAAVVSLVVFRFPSLQRIESRLAPHFDIERHPWGPIISRAANGSVVVLVAVTVLVITLLLRERRVADVLVLMAGLLAGLVVVDLLQRLLMTPRPGAVDSLRLGDEWQNPSGHAFGATVVMVLGWAVLRDVAERPRRLGRVLLVGVGAGVTGLRLLDGEHYLGDVVSGVLAGAAWAAGCIAVRVGVPSLQRASG